jgi:uncharacterized protein YciI
MLFHLTGQITDLDKVGPLRDEEMRMTSVLLDEGVMQRSLKRSDGPGVFVIVEAEDEAEARGQMERLPFVSEGVLEFDYAPVTDLGAPSTD